MNKIDTITLIGETKPKKVYNFQIKNDIKEVAYLGKSDFLKLLITQLKYQDPTDPMKDKEFIAQMAQFSALEQMTNMSKSFEKLSSLLSVNKALDLLGKVVEFQYGGNGEVIKGRVTNVKTGIMPQIMVNGNYYEYENILSVGLEE